MDLFEPYSHALAALALWALLICVLIPVSAAIKSKELSPCGKTAKDYSDPAYRRERALQNAMESSGPFIAATVAAILVGASPFWVNLLASIFIVARLATAAVHILTTNTPARSATWGVGMVAVLGLALLALIGAFF